MENRLTYVNLNYQRIPDTSDENLNVEISNLQQELDASRRIPNRRKYASLDPVSMGVDLDLESTTNAKKNLNQGKSQKNGNSTFNSNDNKDMGKKSTIFDYYISLEEKPPFQNPSYFPNAVEKYEKLSSTVDPIPTGWEKHEDDSGPYYWHINSGTIQRDHPLLQTQFSKNHNKMTKDFELFSSGKEHLLNSQKATCDNFFPNSFHRSNFLGIPSANDKIKRHSCPDGSSSLPSVKQPIRFAVRSLGWVEIAEEDLTPERSSKAVNKCIVDLSVGRNDILDVVGRWGDGKNLFMDLDDCSLCLMDTQDFTVLNRQPVHTIRVWGVGRDNGRDFAYVASDRVTKKYMCHVFRCDIPARIIANTLRDICKKIMIDRSLNKHSESITDKPGTPVRPTDLLMEKQLFPLPSSYTGQLFPTPMEEPKKVLKAYYLGAINVSKATGVDILNDAIEKVATSLPKTAYKYVNVAVAPSTITITELGDDCQQLAECRVRFLSFMGIGKNIKHCGFIVHTAKDEFIAHVFHCEPSSGALCKTIEAACKLRYQKCLDSHRQDTEFKNAEEPKKGLKTTLKSVLGALL